jgi:hypothetical protein
VKSSVIYLVVGSCGDHPNWQEWIVTFRVTREDAEAILALCEKEAAEQRLWTWNGRLPEDNRSSDKVNRWWYDRRASEEAEDRRARMFDTHYEDDYWGVQYKIREVYEDPREDPWWETHTRWREEQRAKERARIAALVSQNDTQPLTQNLGAVLQSALGSEHEMCLDCDARMWLHWEGVPHCSCGEDWPCPER